MSKNRRLLAATDWSGTPLGDRKRWPATMDRVVDAIMYSGFPICTAWGDEGIQIYNDGYNAIYGDKHPGAFGRPLVESWDEISGFLGAALDQVRRTREPLNFKDTLLPLAKRGRPMEYYFDFSYSAVCDEEGRTLGLMSVATETTEACIYRRRQDSCALSQQAMERSGFDGVVRDIHERLSPNDMDAQVAALFRVTPETPDPARPAWQLRATDAQVSAMRDLLPGIRGGQVQSIRLDPGSVLATDGAEYAAVVPLCDDDARVLALLVMVPHGLVEPDGHLSFCRSLGDRLRGIITPNRALDRVRRHMAEQDHLYRFLFENIADPAIYARTDGRSDSGEWVLAANPAACRLLGYSADELVGMSRDALVDQADPGLDAALRERERKRVFVGELGFLRKDGSRVPVEVSSRLVQTEGGERRSVNLLRDISERLSREAERERRSRHETIARLTGGFAHDFNNLLAVITGSLDLARDALPAQSPVQRHLATAELCAGRGAALTGQLLSYARLQPLRLQPVDLNEQLRAIRDWLAATAGRMNTIEFHADVELPACRADPAQLTTALINLVANARDAMPSGGRIEVRTDTVLRGEQEGNAGDALPPGRYVRLSVRDHGPGIDPALRERIFEPYVSSKEATKGSGLGLAMVQGLLRQCGGDVLARDAPGGGARFELLFPALDGARAQPEAPAGAGTAQAETIRARILLVEDSAEVREVLGEMLANAGHAVRTANSGRDALALLGGQGEFDLLLTDLVMPGGVSGLALAQEARRRYPAMPILLITGHDPWGVTQAHEGLAFELLTKPITRSRLLEAVSRALAGARDPSAPPAH